MLPDSENPWCVLVPPVADRSELHQLSEAQQQLLLKDINRVSATLEIEFKPDKLNIGALGNIVPQLHIHIICRYQTDRAWPNPIWGTKTGSDKVIINKNCQRLKELLF